MIDTSRPASRILTMLEILQDHPGISGPELSERLDVSSRTIRRYIVTLQDMGIPVEPTPGRSGGYALRPGFRLPPLMFSADEAVGLAMALLTTQVNDCTLPEPVERALAKIERVLPHQNSPSGFPPCAPKWNSMCRNIGRIRGSLRRAYWYPLRRHGFLVSESGSGTADHPAMKVPER